MHLNRQIQYYNSPYKKKTVTFSSDLLPVRMGLLIGHSWKHPISAKVERKQTAGIWEDKVGYITQGKLKKSMAKKNIFHMTKY